MSEDSTSRMAREIATMIMTMMMVHDEAAKKPINRIRKADGLPYGVHPALAAFLMLHETSFPVQQRLLYARALNFHDFKEDTNGDPTLIGHNAEPLVDLLTFTDDMDTTDEAIRGVQRSRC